MKKRLLALIALTICVSICCRCGSNDAPSPFVRVEQGRFLVGGRTVRFVGANFWYGAVLATAGEWGDRERLARELDRMQELGIDNLRVLVGSDGDRNVHSKVEPVLQTAPGEYDDEVLDGLDYLMAELGRRGMYAVLYLNNSWEWSGGYCQYLQWTGRGTYPVPGVAGWDRYMEYVKEYHRAESTDSCKLLFADHVRKIVTRTNRYTGRPYTEDPAIFSWQIANEPRAFADENKERFAAWIGETARLIKSLDPNHMVSTGSEGEAGCEKDMELWRRIHAFPEIDYANIHIWPYNWGWISQTTVEEQVEHAEANTRAYIERHLAVARELGKPVVAEEFGYPRDGFRFEPGSPTAARDAYYGSVFDLLIRDAARDGLFAGCNFWGWGGYARPTHLRWERGDDYCGDPAQEEQGLNSVFADDTTADLIREANRTLRRLCRMQQAPADNRSTAGILNLLRRVEAEHLLLFGQQDFPFYGVEWTYEPGRSDVREVCGDYPAVLGCELGEIELGNGRNLDGIPFDTMRREIVRHYLRGGLTTVSWHPRNPVTGGDAWDVSDTAAVRAVLPGGAAHAEFLGWLDTVADFLLSLRTPDGDPIPVMFRPWHEHTGSWFWWGERLCSADEYRALWRMTVGRLRNRGVEMLTVYSPNPVATAEEYLGRYPGDAWVDLLGVDCYQGGPGEEFVRRLDASLAVMDRLSAERGKPAAVTETGSEGIPEADWWTARLAKATEGHSAVYALVWRNAYREQRAGHYYVPYPGHASAGDFLKFRAGARIRFAGDMPALFTE